MAKARSAIDSACAPALLASGTLGRQAVERNEVDASGKKLHKARLSDQIDLVRPEFLERVMGKQHGRRRQGRAPLSRLLQLIEKDDPGPVGDGLGDGPPVHGAKLASDDKGRLFTPYPLQPRPAGPPNVPTSQIRRLRRLGAVAREEQPARPPRRERGPWQTWPASSSWHCSGEA